MIKSMTAYATAERSTEKLMIAAEIRSYNSRQLDIGLRLPPGYVALEEKLKELIYSRAIRGRIEIKILIESGSQDTQDFEIDQSRARSYFLALGQLKEQFACKDDISLDLLLSPGGIIKPVESIENTEAVWPALKDCVSQALDDLDLMRKREGDFIAQDLITRLERIAKHLNQIKRGSSGLLPFYQRRLKERISLLTQDIVELDLGRIAQEAAFLADRSDISEEIVRAASHLKQFRRLMRSDEPAGRKLNFLLQELHREFNTMGSKVGNAELSHMIVEVKSELEKIREQIQNVE